MVSKIPIIGPLIALVLAIVWIVNDGEVALIIVGAGASGVALGARVIYEIQERSSRKAKPKIAKANAKAEDALTIEQDRARSSQKANPKTAKADAKAEEQPPIVSAPGSGSAQDHVNPNPDSSPAAISVREAEEPPVISEKEVKPALRFLVAQMPQRVPLSAEMSLLVRVSAEADAFPEAKLRPITGLDLGAHGTRVTIVVQAPRELVAMEALEQVIFVPADGDSDPVRFAFQARSVGLHRVVVSAWAGGTFLAELAMEVSVQAYGPYVDAPALTAPVGAMEAKPGEVTLQVSFDGHQYTFQLLSKDCFFEPVLAEAVTARPDDAVERTLAMLRSMAEGSARYTPGNARMWIEQAGVGLWNDMVPVQIKEQFWQLRKQISSFSIAIAQGRDVIPWELLYPLAKDTDEGFLVQQFPVMRRVFGQQRFHRITVGDATYVVPAGSPGNAQREIAAIHEVLAAGTPRVDIVRLNTLVRLIESERAGLLHFACHSTFRASAGGSEISMEGGAFTPLMLNKAVTQQALRERHPLVFVNACRSAGAVPEYTRMMGWAEQFMAAGAGAFVGTLWAIRSENASEFAQSFYGEIIRGSSLGAACHKARLATERDDPTWLAYSVYGDPDATVMK